MKIIILTETSKNESVQLIKRALEAQFSAHEFQAIVVEKQLMDKTQFDVESGNLRVPYLGYFGPRLIHANEIALVVVRTWTDKRDPVIALSRALHAHGVPVLDVDAMDWTLSKIAQYQSLQQCCHPFPESICFDAEWMKNNRDLPIPSILEQVSALGFPLVIKTSRGSRGTGVYRVSDEAGLSVFLADYFSDQLKIPKKTKDDGLIIQRYVPPYEATLLSTQSVYFRVNVVEQKICSAVQFEIQWENAIDGKPYEKINIDTHEDNDWPISIEPELQVWYENILPYFPHPLNVVGLDVMKGADGQYFLLEVNCGPNISGIEKLGYRFPGLAGAENCQRFSHEIAQLLVKKANEYVQAASLRNETNRSLTNTMIKI